MNFKTLDEVKDLFLQGAFHLPEYFTVNGVTYTQKAVSPNSILETIREDIKSAIVYTAESNDSVVFLWGRTPRYHIVPYGIRSMNVSPNAPVVEADVNKPDQNFIGSSVEIRITNLPGGVALKGKVDTGAEVCSLHAVNWKISNGNVSFQCPELSSNVITMPLADQQAVKTSDGGVEYRPVIELNIRINGKLINGVMFNLNDRGKMEFPILVGRNALQAGKFKIDPSMDEGHDGIDWKRIQDSTKGDVFLLDPVNEALSDIIERLQHIIDKKL